VAADTLTFDSLHQPLQAGDHLGAELGTVTVRGVVIVAATIAEMQGERGGGRTISYLALDGTQESTVYIGPKPYFPLLKILFSPPTAICQKVLLKHLFGFVFPIHRQNVEVKKRQQDKIWRTKVEIINAEGDVTSNRKKTSTGTKGVDKKNVDEDTKIEQEKTSIGNDVELK
jgi:hypothetical protein